MANFEASSVDICTFGLIDCQIDIESTFKSTFGSTFESTFGSTFKSTFGSTLASTFGRDGKDDEIRPSVSPDGKDDEIRPSFSPGGKDAESSSRLVGCSEAGKIAQKFLFLESVSQGYMSLKSVIGFQTADSFVVSVPVGGPGM